MYRILIVACTLILVGCEPMGPMPGGKLAGKVQPVPENWEIVRDIEIIQLETRPEDPYSLNLWGVAVDSNFYIASGKGHDSSWVEHLSRNPNVRLRIAENIYELKAIRVKNKAELEGISKRYTEKYEFDQEDDRPEEAWIYRLDPR